MTKKVSVGSAPYFLYGILNTTNNKMYIGVTCNPSRRWKRHKSTAKSLSERYKYAIHWAIAKYGSDKFIFKIIEELPNKQLAFDREIEFIKLLKENNFQLYNETDGGEGGSFPEWTEEQRQKMSKLMSGEGNPMYGVQLFGPANGNYGKKMKSHVKETLLKCRRKLTDEQIHEIKNLYAGGNYSQTSLAKQFNISLTQMHRIVKGKRWLQPGQQPPKTKPRLKPEQVKEMRNLYDTGNYTQLELAKKYNISDTQVRRIIKRIKWKNI